MRFIFYWTMFFGTYLLYNYIDQYNGHINTPEEKLNNLIITLGMIIIILLCNIRDKQNKQLE